MLDKPEKECRRRQRGKKEVERKRVRPGVLFTLTVIRSLSYRQSVRKLLVCDHLLLPHYTLMKVEHYRQRSSLLKERSMVYNSKHLYKKISKVVLNLTHTACCLNFTISIQSVSLFLASYEVAQRPAGSLSKNSSCRPRSTSKLKKKDGLCCFYRIKGFCQSSAVYWQHLWHWQHQLPKLQSMSHLLFVG